MIARVRARRLSAAGWRDTGEAVTRTSPNGGPLGRTAARSVVNRISPLSEHVAGYRAATLRQDLVAGLTVAALAIPSAMAYAELAGLPPVAGLYGLLLPVSVYTFLGSSRHLIVGPEGSISALVAAAVVPLAVSDPERYASLAAMLALVVGGLFLLAWIVRLGWVADYLSRAVLTGYIHGVALILIVGQLGTLFGLDIDSTEPLPQILELVSEISQLSVPTMAAGAACVTALVVLPRLASWVPWPLLTVALAIGASAALDLGGNGVATVGMVPSGLPDLALPEWRLHDLLDLLPAALGILLVSFSDEILTARSFAGRHGQHVRADQELLAMGLANAAAGCTQSFCVGASGSRTAVNEQTGGRTQLSGLMGAAGVASVLMFATEPLRYLPRATLGAVIVVAALALVNRPAWVGLRRVSRAEVLIAAATTIGVILVGVLQALVVAVALSFVDVVRRSATPHDAVLGWVERLGRYADVRTHPRARVTPGVLVYRLDDRLFFGNAAYVRGRVHEAIDGAQAPVRWLIFDAEGLSHVDATGVVTLRELIVSLRQAGIVFVVARLKGPMQRTFQEVGLLDVIGEHAMYPTVRDAVEAAAARDEG
jgi:sulfate permease, SulP family